ncbi:MAG: histidine kinase [Niastella sp.]|uniref:sensor histidine kinase n=1 Tax=Niastella sp. TaxID=1869183 RepID=UPI00389A2F86
MENDFPNQSTNQLLIQHISEAALFTDPCFTITACNPAASVLFLYNQQDILGHSISFLVPASSTTNSRPSIVNTTFREGIIEYIDSTGKIILLHTTRQAIAPGLPTGGYLFIYKPLDADHTSTGSFAQLRELSEHLLNIRETERTRIAREIHDELGQQLTILKMDLSWLNQKLKNSGDASVLQKTGDALIVLNETIRAVRRIATELRPSMLDDLGLIEAMEWQSREFEKRSGIKIIFESGISHLPVDNDVATSLFRIYQEALTNIARHANAKTVLSKLQVMNDQVILTIADDGVGFDMQTLAIKKTLGLLGMKERALMMGGRFNINSKPGEGTTIIVTTSL